MPRLAGLFLYPVKSCRGVAVPAAAVDALGLVGDRRFLVVDETGRFLTQRSHPRLALVVPTLTPDALHLTAAGHGTIQVPRAAAGPAPTLAVTVWRSEQLQAEDCGDEAARWFGDFLGLRCRLARIGRDFHRPVLKAAARPGDVVNFADAVPFLALGEASLADLNDRLVAQGEEPVPMDRFRPNLVLAGSPPYAEDTWTRCRIGDLTFRHAGPCARCVVTTTDQLTAARGKEPLRTLATYRRDPDDPTDVNFGVNLIHESRAGTLRVGDAVTVEPAP